MNAELRWTPARFMDMAVFYDTGKVASRREDLDFEDLKESYGIGMRLIGLEGYVLRIEVAHSREHNARLIFSAGRRRSSHGCDKEMAAEDCVVSSRRRPGPRGSRRRPALPDGGSTPTIRSRRIVDSQDASGVQERDINLIYDTLENSVSWPGDQTPNVRAQNVNTVDEVPDSNWFTNRLGTRAVTVDELLKGPDTGNGPAPGTWTVIAAKNDGVTPGFTVRDSTGQVWFLKFDPPGYRGMATGTEVVVTKLFWALGYYLPEVHLASLRPDQLAIDDAARITPPSGKRRRFKQSDIQTLLAQGASRRRRLVPRHRQQSARREARRRLQVLRHPLRRSERRRRARASPRAARVRHVRGMGEPRGLEVDQHARHRDRSEVGGSVVRHNLLDFGSTVGSAGVYPREAVRGLGISGRRRARRWPGSPRLASTSRTGARSRCIARARLGHFLSTTRTGIPEKLEAALRQLGLPVGAARRQVLGRAPPSGISQTRC